MREQPCENRRQGMVSARGSGVSMGKDPELANGLVEFEEK